LDAVKKAAPTTHPIITLLAYMRVMGLNQVTLAQLVGLSQTTVSLWFDRARVPDPRARKVLEELCSIPAELWDKGWKAA
jgi:DNA-binding transcriptional regulator YiaG